MPRKPPILFVKVNLSESGSMREKIAVGLKMKMLV
jgi:hypothetical protein